MTKRIINVLALCVLSGCASTYKNEVLVKSDNSLYSNLSVFIATPANGSYGGKTYANSGESTANAVRSAFMRYVDQVEVSRKCQDMECLKSESNGNYGYLVVPYILHWEDRATEWSGLKDKLEIKIVVYSIDGTEVSSTIIYGKSKWATFGGDHPQDLLPEPIKQYVQGLYK
ncbi:DUF4823 domain-containing protein [Teredinibacter turnerae]|uniref:DUF4823 domain-containing protein n=1 Tax=Teredinibacter turnerae TaxID=2426 RepID=UPI000674EDD0|nr:DUF4823 domain-containing protein [Teredinibacter turnerae]